MMWEKVRLNDICRPRQWKTLSTNNLLEKGYPVYGANGIIGFYNSYTHEFPTLIITCRGATCGSLHITEPKSYVNGNAMALDSVHKDIDIKFLYYYFSGRGFQDIISGSAQPQITGEGLSKITVPLPPLPIQKRIAEILDTTDALRRKDEALLKKYDELAQAIFIDMFGDPVKNEKGWEVIELGKSISILTDYHSNGSYETLREHVTLKNEPDYALMVRTTDLENNNFTKNVNYITQDAYEYLDKSKIFGGEIIINKIGSAGNIYLMPHLNRPVSLGMNAFLVRLKKNFHPIFIFNFLKTDFGKHEISKRVFGAVTKTITKDAVRSIPIFNVPIEKQILYVNCIEKINMLIEKSSSKKADSLFNSLLQKAFNGELVA